MTDCMKQKLADKDFHHWVKAALAINICKTGIETRVDRTVHQRKDKIFADIQSNDTCFECSIENITYCQTKSVCHIKQGNCTFHNTKEKNYRPCPKNICDKVKKEIARRHTHKFPSWKNTKVAKWYTDPWDIAKCYMPPGRYSHVTGPEDTDLNGILNVIENLKDFETLFDIEATKKAREVSNSVRHSSDLLLSDSQMKEDLDELIDFLRSSNDVEAVEAAENIQKLQNDELMISTADVTNVLQEVIQENVHGMNLQTVKFLQDTKDSLDTVQISTTDHLSQILLALTDLKDATKDIMENIQREKNEIKKMTKTMTGDYDENKIKLKEDLLTFNKKHHSTLAFSPFSEKRDSPLIGLYVNPPINAVEQPMRECRRSDIKTPISSFEDVFKPEYKEIYLTSKAGLGKTAFCKRVAVNWCQAHDQKCDKSKCFNEADAKVMSKYDFLFIVLLRNVLPCHCDIDKMICHQIIRHLSRSEHYDDKFIQEVLTQELCLVILDGLDEWSHPEDKEACKTTNDIPHRKARQRCTILTTSRTWKFCLLDLSVNQIHLRIQISELSDYAAGKLIENGISKLIKGDEENLKNATDDFKVKTSKTSILRFKTVPLILMYLMCLWHDKKPFGESKCEVFSNIIGFLLFRADKRSKRTFSGEEHMSPQLKKRKFSFTEPFIQNEYFQQYKKLLMKVSHLAFDSFFSIGKREHSVVFEAHTGRKYLSDQDLEFLKSAGILYQSEFQDELLTHFDQELKLSFAHITFQSFLAAYYFSALNSISDEMKVVREVCKSAVDILSVADFYICLSGLCPDKANLVSRLFSEVISKSDITEGYRKDLGSWNYFIGYNENVKKLQTMQVHCLWECEENGQNATDIKMEDFIIDLDFKQEKYSKSLLKLMENNRKNIKSLKIRDVTTSEKFHEILEIETLKTHSASHLMKLDIKCEFEMKDLECVLKGSEKTLKCLIIKGGKWFGNK